MSKTQKVSKNSKNSKSVERERKPETVIEGSLSKSFQGKDSSQQIYSIGPFRDSNFNHDYMKSTIDQDNKSNLPSKHVRRHKSAINLITQVDASSQIVL